ncbi:MAG: HAD family hydrolase [Patescibacteria group bacterium]
MIKLVVFDWNGTLIADLEAATVGCNAKLKIFGHSLITSSQYRQFFEVPTYKMYEQLGVPKNILEAKSREASEAFHAAYEPRVAKVRTRQGARQLLATLEAQGISKILLSNHTTTGIQSQVIRLNLSKFFNRILANADVYSSHLKGKKDRLIDYFQTINFKPSETLIIGDTVEEIAIGQEIGLKTVAITGGFNTKAKLKAAKSDFLIHKLNDLMPILEQL